MAKAERIYWDACTWIAYIKKEMPSADSSFTEHRYTRCRDTLERAVKGEIEIATSAFNLAEVCKAPQEQSSPAINLPAFFDQPYILLVPVDKQVGLRAQNLQLSGVGNLKPPDAVHIASALVWNIPTFHTFDGKLLKLDNLLTMANGNQLHICMPESGTPAPLFERLEEQKDG